MKTCGKCKDTKDYSDFYKNRCKKDGYANRCKSCANLEERLSKQKNPISNRESSSKFVKRNNNWNNNKAAKYRAAKLNAIPEWADLDKIEYIYLNNPKGYHVDHIIPLQGKEVCGLHIETNLQYLIASDNYRKSNKLDQSLRNK